MAQNTSHAVMAQRHEPKDSADNFPTPPWATRGLIEHVLIKHRMGDRGMLKQQSVWEPACGAGHMSKVLAEYFGKVRSSDKYDYGYEEAKKLDFLECLLIAKSVDWVITNPPFNEAERFVLRSLIVARKGVAILARSTFTESVGRYNRIYRKTPPTYVVQIVERVPMVRGRLDPKASTATSYFWLVWKKPLLKSSEFIWIPPCRKKLERAEDYE